MAEASYLQSNFLGGEWSQTYQGRMDDPHYRTALNVCLNMFPTEQGALTRRSGTQFLQTTRGGGKGRVTSFDIEESQPYILEYTDGFLRFRSFEAIATPNPSGYGLVTTNDAQTVAAISSADPAVVTTSNPHGWSTGNTVIFVDLGTNNTLLQNRQFLITVINATQFSLQDALTGANIDGSTLMTFVSGTVARILELVTPYLSGTWSNIIQVQAETIAVLLNGQQPQVLELITAPGGGADGTFQINPIILEDGPYLDPFNGSQVTYSALVGNITLTFAFQPYSASVSYSKGDFVTHSGQGYQSLQDANLNNTPGSAPTFWTPVNGGAPVGPNGFTHADIGRHIRLFSEPAAWSAGGSYSAGDLVTFNDGFWQYLSGGSGNPTPGTDLTTWAPVTGTAYATWTWGRIISVSGTGLINPGTAIGNFNAGAGIGAAFDGATSKTFASSAQSPTVTQPAYQPFNSSVGYASGTAVYFNGFNYSCGQGYLIFSGGSVYAADQIIIYGIYYYQRTTFQIGKSGFGPTGFASNNQYWVFVGVGNPSNTTIWNLIGAAPNLVVDTFVGQNFSASHKTIQQATIFPSNDRGIANNEFTYIICNLWASQTSPATPSNGTLLGTVTVNANSTAPITIPSNNSTTAYAFVWVEMFAFVAAPLPFNGTNSFSINLGAAQVEFFSSNVNNGSVVTIQLVGPPLLYSGGTITTWQAGVYTSNGNIWPTCGCYHEGRLWLGGAVPNRWDSSNSNDLFNFAPTGPDGTVADNNGISFLADSDGVNATYWMHTDALGIIIGTEGGEWLMQSTTQGLPITPSNVQAHRVTTGKCAPIEAIRTEHTLAVVQKQQRKVMELFADVYSGKFTAPNLMERARHLTANYIEEIRYQNEITPTVWARDGIGNWFGCTYQRNTLMTSEGPTFYGWHRHALGSSRIVESIAVGPSQGGALDALVMVTNDPATGIRHVEVLADMFEETDNYQNAWFLDDAVTPTSYVIGATGLTINGLWHLNGKTVQVFVGGLDAGLQNQIGSGLPVYSDFTVANGSITVPYGDGVGAGSGGGLLTQTFCNSFQANLLPIVVGFTYTSQAQMVRPASPAETGSRSGPAFGKLRRTHYYVLQVVNTNGVQIGTGFINMDIVPWTSINGTSSYPLPNLFNGVMRDNLGDLDSDSFDGQLAVQITRPIPALITAFGGIIDTKDI